MPIELPKALYTLQRCGDMVGKEKRRWFIFQAALLGYIISDNIFHAPFSFLTIQVEAVEALLEHGATVNAQNTMTGATPLHCAIQSMKGSLELRRTCMERLIAAGADLSLCDFFGKMPVDYCGEEASLAKLLQPTRPVLFQSLEDGQLDQVREIVQISSDSSGSSTDTTHPVHQKFMGQTPFDYTLDLLLAEEAEDDGEWSATHRPVLLAMLKILLDAGSNPNAYPKDNDNPMGSLEGPVLSPLHRVCHALQDAYKNDNSELVSVYEDTARLLVQHKAKITPELEQLLHTTCRKNEMEMTKFLIEVLRFNPNVKGRQGMTPLQFAARSGKSDMVQYLLSQPAIDITIQDDRGQTALDAARVNNKQDIVVLLEEFANQRS
jgi:ankyrin repeat protein